MCSSTDFGEKGYELHEQILFNILALYLTLVMGRWVNSMQCGHITC